MEAMIKSDLCHEEVKIYKEELAREARYFENNKSKKQKVYHKTPGGPKKRLDLI